MTIVIFLYLTKCHQSAVNVIRTLGTFLLLFQADILQFSSCLLIN